MQSSPNLMNTTDRKIKIIKSADVPPRQREEKREQVYAILTREQILKLRSDSLSQVAVYDRLLAECRELDAEKLAV